MGVNYKQYIQSNHWRRTRKQKLKEAGGICERCRRNDATQAHHLHYGSLGKEKMEDLQAVCRPCHEKIHNIETTPTIQTLGFNCLQCPSETCEVFYGPHYIYRICLGCRDQTKSPKKKWKQKPKKRPQKSKKKKRQENSSKVISRNRRKKIRRKKEQERERITFESLAKKKRGSGS